MWKWKKGTRIKPGGQATQRVFRETWRNISRLFHGRGRSALEQMRRAIRPVLPRQATEVISYRIPAFKLHRIVVWYAGFSEHCSLFPTAEIITEFADELKGYATSKGTIHFPLDTALPISFIKRIVKARVARVEGVHKVKGRARSAS